MSNEWTAARIARPSSRYDAVVDFYRDIVGLRVLSQFAEHHGYDGTIFSLLDERVQFELTRHASGQPTPAPTDEDLLVLYYANAKDRVAVEARLGDAGYEPVQLANPFWVPDSTGYRDPDGWILVLTLQD